MKLRRIAVGLAALATVLAATAAPAAAENPYQPSDADFADCPAKPSGVQGSWTCYVMTVVDGVVRLDKMSANLSAPWRLTLAQGTVNGVTVAKLGGLRADSVPFVTGIPGTPFVTPHPTGWKVRPYATGQISPGFVTPSSIGVKFQVIGNNLGDSCYVGSDTSPVTLKPKVSWWIPWIFGTTPMFKSQVYDDVYSLPASSGCDNAFTVNTLLGVPANATSNYLQVQWAFRSKEL